MAMAEWQDCGTLRFFLKWKTVFEYIPIESQIEKFQDEYYDAIAKCHIDGTSTIFIEFMLSQIDKILDDISAQISEDQEQPAIDMNLIRMTIPDKPNSRNQRYVKV